MGFQKRREIVHSDLNHIKTGGNIEKVGNLIRSDRLPFVGVGTDKKYIGLILLIDFNMRKVYATTVAKGVLLNIQNIR